MRRGREKYLVCFHVLEDKEISNMWTKWTRDSDLNFFFYSDSDSEVMTRTRSWRWWLGLGLKVMTRTRIWQFGLGHSTAYGSHSIGLGSESLLATMYFLPWTVAISDDVAVQNELLGECTLFSSDSYLFVRLDGSMSIKKRAKVVDCFNNPSVSIS